LLLLWLSFGGVGQTGLQLLVLRQRFLHLRPQRVAGRL
jgi:hypothetical protein